MIVYYGGMAYTHGSAGEPVTGQHNSGVGAAKLRMDGFVSLNAPQIFNVASLTVRETRTPIAPPRCNACTVSAPVLLSVTVLTFCLRWLLRAGASVLHHCGPDHPKCEGLRAADQPHHPWLRRREDYL